MKSLDALISKCEELEEESTARPWNTVDTSSGYCIEQSGEVGRDEPYIAIGMFQSDAKFVLNAVNSLPKLIQVIRVAQEALEGYATQDDEIDAPCNQAAKEALKQMDEIAK